MLGVGWDTQKIKGNFYIYSIFIEHLLLARHYSRHRQT